MQVAWFGVAALVKHEKLLTRRMVFWAILLLKMQTLFGQWDFFLAMFIQ